MIIAIDMHGADMGLRAPLVGGLEALEDRQDLNLIFCGEQSQLEKALEGMTYDKSRFCGEQSQLEKALEDMIYDKSRVTVCACGEPVTNNDHPGIVIRRKKDASMFRALELVRDGKADAMVSAGNTGALLAGTDIILKTVPPIRRAAMASIVTSLVGTPTLITDMGANVDCEPQRLMTFAIMGSAYMQKLYGIASPKVALLNNGSERSEREKGNKLVKAARDLLEASPLNFVGYIEPTELMSGKVDVVVTDGFAGNMAIKSYEGMAKAMMSVIKDGIMKGGFKAKLGYLLLKGVFRKVKHTFSADEVGGAVFLGAKGVVVKTHGSSTEESFCKSILNACTLVERGVVGAISEGIAKYAGELG